MRPYNVPKGSALVALTMTADVPLLRLTQVTHCALVDRSGETVGRIDDLIVRLGAGEYPPVTGIEARIGQRHVFVPIGQIAELKPGRVQMTAATVNLGRFERREGEVLLRQDILGRRLIDVETGRLVRAGDIILQQSDGAWRVIGVDVSFRSVLQRALHRTTDRPIDRSTMVDWSHIEPFVGHVPTARLRLPLRRLRRLHPAQIADLVEAASPEEGEEIITAVGGDPELEADVFEELDTEHQVEFLQKRSDTEAAQILGTMAPDDAADLINDLPQARRASILARLPAPQQAKIRGLLAYNPQTAGGLMNPDFLAFDPQSTIEQVLAQVRTAPQEVSTVYAVDQEGHLIGFTPLKTFLWAPHASRIAEWLKPIPVPLLVDADFTEVAILLADYNLVEAAVVDHDGHLVGVISVDDVLETLIPQDWRRRDEGRVG